MSYIGSTPTSQNFTSGTDYFSGTGSQTAYTLTRTVNSVNDIEVVINNVVQQPSTAYTLSGTTITFTSAPSSGTNNIYVRYLATNMQSFTVPANSISRTHLSSDLQATTIGRNRIINGAVNVWQRGTSFSSYGYTADRWSCYADSGFSMSRSTDVPTGFQYSASLTGTGSTGFTQKIEAANIADLASQMVTVSFWMKQSTGAGSGAIGVYLYSADAADNFGSSTLISSQTITTTSSWTKYTLNFTLNSASANGLQVTIKTTSGSSVTFLMTGVQLEEGTTATSFERESYSVTLQKCQRYYSVLSGNGTAYAAIGSGFGTGTTGGNGIVQYPVTMRTVPTVTNGSAYLNTSTANTAITSLSANAGVNSVLLSISVSSGTTTGQGFLITAGPSGTGNINMSAEL